MPHGTTCCLLFELVKFFFVRFHRYATESVCKSGFQSSVDLVGIHTIGGGVWG